VLLPQGPFVRIPESDIDRLLEAAYAALPLMPEEVRNQVANMLTREAMAVIAGVAVVWAGSHFFGVGAVVDVVFAGAAYLAVGWDAFQALRGFADYYQRAVRARTPEDLQAASKLFAQAMISVINAVGWGKLGKWLGKGAGRFLESSAVQLGRWQRFIQAIEFKIPRDRGMLWSKLGKPEEAEKLARGKGLTCLELELKKTGFFQLYAKDFGDVQNGVTKAIWKMVSERYVQSLEGEVTGYVHRAKYFAHLNEEAARVAKASGRGTQELHAIKQNINPGDPVLVSEVAELSKMLLSNPRITHVRLVDIETGEDFGYRTREVLESLRRLEGK
jgi:hypothetical protein